MRICRRSRSTLLPILLLLLLGGPFTAATAQLVQGTDYDTSTQFSDPDNWTAVTINGSLESTVTFNLNPCEYVLYFDTDGNPSSCLGRPVPCATLTEMETTLTDAILVWDNLATNALDLQYGDLVGGNCVVGGSCPSVDAWSDDDDWVVTRTYDYGGVLPTQDCPDADSLSLDGGAGLRFYDDPITDHTTRWIDECDVVFFEEKWDNTEDDCLDQQDLSLGDCIDAWQMALAHEIGHCFGFGHSYLTRMSLDPLDRNPEIPALVEALPSIMSYDRRGSIDAAGGLNPYDVGLYLHTYASDPDPEDDYFTASGKVKADCGGTPELLFGAGVVALKVDGTDLVPVQMSVTGLDPLGDGEFELHHLDRTVSQYRILVVDVRDPNQFDPTGWGFDDQSTEAIPSRNVFQTDDWDEDHAGDDYKYESRARFATGFDYELTAAFYSPATGNDYDAGDLCVDWN